jgi:DNA-binding NtrC family response regulator
MEQLNIFLIDKDQVSLDSYQLFLNQQGYKNVTIFNRATEYALYMEHRPDIVFLGNSLGYELGIELLKSFKSVYPATDVILLPGPEYKGETITTTNYEFRILAGKTDHILNYITCVLDRMTVVRKFLQQSA